MARRINQTSLDAAGAALASGVSLGSAARTVEIAISTAYRYRATIEAIASQSRYRVRAALAQRDYGDVLDLMEAIRRPGEVTLSVRHVVGVLWSLQKRGEVTFTQTSNRGSNGHGPSAGALVHIRARAALNWPMKPLPVAPDPTPEPTEDPTPEPTEDPTPEPTKDPTPEPTPEPTEEFPVLRVLRIKEVEVSRARSASRLIEQEYLRFAEERGLWPGRTSRAAL